MGLTPPPARGVGMGVAAEDQVALEACPGHCAGGEVRAEGRIMQNWMERLRSKLAGSP